MTSPVPKMTLSPLQLRDDGWRDFVLTSGWRAPLHELAAVLGRPEGEIARLRATGTCRRLVEPKRFAELFALWRGRAPTDDEWPAPRKVGLHGTYEWQPPEIALLANLVGQLGNQEIAKILTNRLRHRTGDPSASRSRPRWRRRGRPGAPRPAARWAAPRRSSPRG